jgi:hypothetical protein
VAEVGTMLPKQKTPLSARADVIVSDSLLQGRGQFSRSKADGFDNKTHLFRLEFPFALLAFFPSP